MIIDSWELTAHWGPRRERLDQCALRVLQCIDGLGRVDAALHTWYDSRGAKTPEEALMRKVKPSVEALSPLFLSGSTSKRARDIFEDELGFSFVLWNGRPDHEGTVLYGCCGAYAQALAPFGNYCTLYFPRDDRAADRLLQLQELRQIVAVVVNSFDPDFVSVVSFKLWSATRLEEHRGPWVGWLTYVSDRSCELPPLPEQYNVERFEGSGTLITVDRAERPTADNPADVEAVGQLGDILRSAGVLPSAK